MNDLNEADVQNTIRGWPSSIDFLRSRIVSQKWNLASFDYAVYRVQLDTIEAARVRTITWLNQLRAEYVDERRHQELLNMTAPKYHIQATNVGQIGDGNTQNIQIGFKNLIAQIDATDAPEKEKKEVKTRLAKLLEHPLVNSILSGSAGGIIASLGLK